MLRGLWLLGMAWLGACAWTPTTFTPSPDRAHNLPSDLPGLLSLADALQSRDGASPHELDRSLAAIEVARESPLGAPYELDWREARGASLLGRSLPDTAQRRRFNQRAMAAGRRAISKAPERVEGHYFLALALAFDADESQELERIEPLVQQAERAVALDGSYDEAGPLRLLGKIYLEAPEWPTSIGDKEKAVELLERAVGLSPTGLNQYFLGEALYHDEQLREAHERLHAAMAQTGERRLRKPWRSLAAEYLEELEIAGFVGVSP